jgi:cytochrome bd ubiquinol oxidase subunit II
MDNALLIHRLFALSGLAGIVATLQIRPQLLDNYKTHLWGWTIPLVAIGGLAAVNYFRAGQQDLAAFLASTSAIAGILGDAAFGLYPKVLPSTLGEQYDLTIWNTAAQSYGLRIGVVWWTIGMVLAMGYFSYLHYSFRGKVTLDSEAA